MKYAFRDRPFYVRGLNVFYYRLEWIPFYLYNGGGTEAEIHGLIAEKLKAVPWREVLRANNMGKKTYYEWCRFLKVPIPKDFPYNPRRKHTRCFHCGQVIRKKK